MSPRKQRELETESASQDNLETYPRIASTNPRQLRLQQTAGIAIRIFHTMLSNKSLVFERGVNCDGPVRRAVRPTCFDQTDDAQLLKAFLFRNRSFTKTASTSPIRAAWGRGPAS